MKRKDVTNLEIHRPSVHKLNMSNETSTTTGKLYDLFDIARIAIFT